MMCFCTLKHWPQCVSSAPYVRITCTINTVSTNYIFMPGALSTTGCSGTQGFRILSWGGAGKHDGSRMIVACKRMLTHV